MVFSFKILKFHFLFLLFVATTINFEESYWNCQEKGRKKLEFLYTNILHFPIQRFESILGAKSNKRQLWVIFLHTVSSSPCCCCIWKLSFAIFRIIVNWKGANWISPNSICLLCFSVLCISTSNWLVTNQFSSLYKTSSFEPQ